jgi:uncharacterized protein (TIGR03000 family)
MPAVEKPAEEKAKPESSRVQRANVVVKLPQNAKLFVDDTHLSRQEGSEVRNFVTPELKAGQEFFYTMRCEATVNGKPVAETKRVLIKAGSTVEVNFTETPDAVVAR